MNRISFTVEVAKDGGLVVYADEGGTQQDLVFGGNQKDTCGYLAKRVGELKAEKLNAVPKTLREEYLTDRLVDYARVGAAA